MKIIFVTDYVCPYCIVGKAALKEAIKELEMDVEIETYPMELTVEPEEKVDTWSDQNRREHYKILFQPARELGIDAKFPPHVIPRPYTRLAFEGHYYALEKGLAEEYDDAIYRAYFLDEEDIGEIPVLQKVAASVGLDAVDFAQALTDGIYTEREKEMDMYSKTVLDVHKVPTLIINEEKINFQNYSKEEAIEILKRFY